MEKEVKKEEDIKPLIADALRQITSLSGLITLNFNKNKGWLMNKVPEELSGQLTDYHLGGLRMMDQCMLEIDGQQYKIFEAYKCIETITFNDRKVYTKPKVKEPEKQSEY